MKYPISKGKVLGLLTAVKDLPRINALAYFALLSVTERKMFKNIDTVGQSYKTFFIVKYARVLVPGFNYPLV